MFDVDWTDYTSETVETHKARKDVKNELKRKEDTRSGRASVSTRSSSSSADKTQQQGFLGSIGLRRGAFSSKSKKAIPPSLQTIKDNDGDQSQRNSAFIPSISTISTLPFTLSSITSEDQTKSSGDGSFLGHIGTQWGESPDRSSKGSLLSKVTEITCPTTPVSPPFSSPPLDLPASKATTSQQLGPGSFVTQTTETMIESRNEVDVDTVTSEVVIRADPANQLASTPTPPDSTGSPDMSASLELAVLPIPPASPTPPVSPRSTGPTAVAESAPASLMLDFFSQDTPQPSCTQTLGSAGETKETVALLRPGHQYQLHPKTPTKLRRPRNHLPGPPRLAKLNIDNPDSWKPPDAWDRCPVPDRTSLVAEDLRKAAETEEAKDNSIAMDLAGIQREIQKMTVASHQIMLVRLTEEWGNASDGTFYRELEMEKKRWMLSALYSLDHMAVDDSTRGRKMTPKARKILALFEPNATASYLAALHPKIPITHMAPAPLSHRLFPNVVPHYSPVASKEAMTLAPACFTSVYCHAMPALVPSQDIPQLLRNINRSLVPRGILHLALIDPLPVASTMGPRMRAWLEDHLMLNLESKFRCMSPSKLFPVWLKEARLRGDGSLITKVRFKAVSGTRPSEIPGTQANSKVGDKSVKAELRTLVGQMLWQEVWGTFATAQDWWWQSADCIDECTKYGTVWEYSLIEAVKDSDC